MQSENWWFDGTSGAAAVPVGKFSLDMTAVSPPGDCSDDIWPACQWKTSRMDKINVKIKDGPGKGKGWEFDDDENEKAPVCEYLFGTSSSAQRIVQHCYLGLQSLQSHSTWSLSISSPNQRPSTRPPTLHS